MIAAVALLTGLLIPLAGGGAIRAEAAETLSFTAGLKTGDTDPATGALSIPGAVGATALDYQNRSIGVDLGTAAAIDEVTLVNRTASSRVTAADWSIWISDDNVSWRAVTGWTFTDAIVSGAQRHTFSSLDVTARYLKVNSAFSDSAFTFSVASGQAGIVVRGTAFPASSGVMTYTPGVLTGDTAPTTTAVTFPCCAGAVALDYQNRSLGFDLGEPVTVDTLTVINRNSSSRVTADSWTLWASDDNVTYRAVTGWAFGETVIGGKQHHVFSGVNHTARYFKLRSAFADSAFTFVASSGAEAFVVRGFAASRLLAGFKLITPDWDPMTGRAHGTFDSAPGAFGLDYLRRSVVADIGGVGTIERIALRDSDSSTRLTASDYSIWVSEDNQSYQQLTGWGFNTSTIGGRGTHTFDGFSVPARYIKIAQGRADTAFTFSIANATNDFRIYGSVPVSPPQGTGLRVIDSWEVTTDATFPNDTDPSTMEAFRPAVTRAANGDLVMVFNTSTDGNPGGEVRLIRSIDDGETWSTSEILATPSIWPDGSMASSRGLTTLDDGTLILTFGEAVNHQRFGNREGVKYVARSTDHGVTWTGLTVPITLPEPYREVFDAGGRILETSDGTLLLPFWGSRTLSPHWQTSPNASAAVVLRSFDGGVTWPDMRTVGFDVNVPPITAPQFGSYTISGGLSEFDVKEMPDGRLVALIRTNSATDPLRFQQVRSYSDDGGATWSEPQAIGYLAPAFSFDYAPCSASLPAGQSKLVIGHRGITDNGKSLIAVSFDEGVTWQDQTALVDPLGRDYYGLLGGEVEFVPLDDRRMLAFFQASDDDRPFVPPGEISHPWRVMVNVIEDAAPADCAAQAAAAVAALEAQPTLLMERSDRDQWMIQLGTRNASVGSSATVGDVIDTYAPALGCRADQTLQLLDTNDSPLAETQTIAASGLSSGDTVRLRNPSHDPGRPVRIGVTDLDAAPGHRLITNWDDACESTRLELDTRGRSLGLDVTMPAGNRIEAVELRSMFASSRLSAANYTLWAGDENGDFTQLSGWSLVPRIESGHLVHRFTGINSAARYLKITTSYTNAAFTFVLEDPSEDITVEWEVVP